MAQHDYSVIELVGTSTESWEKAAAAAIDKASTTIRDARIAEVVELDMHNANGRSPVYRAKLRVSFKYHMIFSLTPKFHKNSTHW